MRVRVTLDPLQHGYAVGVNADACRKTATVEIRARICQHGVVVLRRLTAAVSALVVLLATTAPSIATAAAPIANLCHCPMHDHCPAAKQAHVCHMPGTTSDADSIGHCDSGSLFAVPALAP